MEFFVFLVLLIVIYRWNKRRRRSQTTPVYSPNHHGHSFQGHSSGQGEGWFPDPTGRYAGRYWAGQGWTEWVMTASQQVSSDPIVVNIQLPGAREYSQPTPTVHYQAPEPTSQVDGPDLNELRRRFRS